MHIGFKFKMALVFAGLVLWLFVGLSLLRLIYLADRNEIETARTEGYAAGIADVSIVIANGGGIDEVLAFAKVKSSTGFHDGFRTNDIELMEKGDGR